MANQPPAEAQRLISEFKAQQAGEEAARKANQKLGFEKGKPQVERKQWTAQELEAEAVRMGFALDRGGKHPHIVDPTSGRYVASLPEHPGNLCTGTARGILRALRTRRSRQ